MRPLSPRELATLTLAAPRLYLVLGELLDAVLDDFPEEPTRMSPALADAWAEAYAVWAPLGALLTASLEAPP